MDEHGLPTVGAGVDYTKVPALEHKTTLTFINKYIVHTSQFLNKFSCVCEERLFELSRRIQQLDISLSILEAKLSSIPDLEGVQATRQYEPPANVASAGAGSAGAGSAPAGGGASAATPAPPTSSAPSSGPPLPSSQPVASSEPIPPPQAAPQAEASQRKKAKDDPRYQKFFKMKRLGVNPLQIAMNMKRDGLNPDILEDEDADLPDAEGGGGGLTMKGGSDSSGSEESDSDNSSAPSEQDSDDSDGYD